MKFIEIHNSQGKREFININWIEEVIEDDNGKCTIYFAFADAEREQEYVEPAETYDEVIKLIKEQK